MHRGNGYWVAVGFDRHHCEVRAVGVPGSAVHHVGGVYADADFHRRFTGVINGGRERYQIANVNRVPEEHTVYRKSDDITLGIAAGACVGDFIE